MKTIATHTKRCLRLLILLSVAAVSAICLEAQQPATSREAKQLSHETQQEISRTRAQISENEKQVRDNLAELSRLEADIATNQKIVTDMAAQVKSLDGKIGTISSEIGKNERDLERMRAEYMKAVKKMRRARGRHSALAFIFSSKDFNQALRRMRYLREFSAWRDRQSDKIKQKVGVLRTQKSELGKTRKEKDVALGTSRRATQQMKEQHKRQDEVIAQLRRNGDALRAHLAEKQREADVLKAQISSLIAQEQAKAEAERQARAKADAERKARLEAERRAREQARAEAERRAARERAEKERKAAEARAEAERKAQQAKAEAERKAAQARTDAERKEAQQAKAEARRQEERAKAEKAKAEKARTEKQTSDKERRTTPSGEEYAKARGRKPREQKQTGSQQTVPEVSKAENSNGGFAALKGSLPHPASGSFRIISQFGKHALPDLPQVVYDNPGIDAEVSAGSHAQAVYQGKVSGVYLVPGYNTVVIVNHGDYYTVYGNIAAAAVKVGDTVKAGQSLGSLARDPDNDKRTTIHFEVWHNREKQNPAAWIR